MINISKLSFGYGKQKLFDNLNIQIKCGHLYGLLGQNGAGKSTLLKIIAGLVFPQNGSCKIEGTETSRRQPDTLQSFFFLPEDLDIQDISSKNLADRMGPFYYKFDHQNFITMLDQFDIEANISLLKLSYGQQKKAMIAFALATNTPLLLLDEPTNGMDIPSKIQFRKIIASAITDDRCIVISTHQVRDLDNLIDSLLILHRHKIMVDMTLDEISEKLNFITSSSVSGNFLYAEEGIGGTKAITVNSDIEYGNVDTELLFNAIISNNKQLLTILNGSNHE